MNQTLKRYLISSGTTFIAVFALVLLPEISDFTMESLKSGAILGVIVTAIRAGIKAAVEVIIPYFQELLK